MRTARWHTSPLSYDIVRKLSRALNISEVLASVLARRGHNTPEAASKFLSPTGKLYDPFLFPQMEQVCTRLRQAILNKEKVCVHGDYDVDGITSTALLVSILKELGANVCCHLPNRFSEGYGIAVSAVEKIAAEGTSLLVTVDCGISALEPLKRAKALGLETIVIDHHRPVEKLLPPAIIISPLLCDYPFKELAGVGLAFKVVQGLFADSDSESTGKLHPALQQLLDLVALGTIADVVPLLDENRSLVKRGLVQLARTHRPGLRALMQVSQVEQSRINAGLVAFRLAPRLNAAGRLEDAGAALELLLAEEEKEAQQLANHLNALNRERQRIENQMVAEAEALVGRFSDEQRAQRGYVLSSPKWHEGIIGIVASRLVEMHHRPVIMIAESDDCGKGSGRSIPAFDLHESLLKLSHLLTTFGGHRAACGLTINLEQIPEFTREFAAYADATLGDDDLHPSRYIDALVLNRELTLELAEELALMEPFGLGNPSVDLLAASVQIHSGRTTRDGRHLQCQIEAGGARSSAIGFGQAYQLDKLDSSASWDVVFRLERNEFNGSVAPQLNLREIFPRPRLPELPPGICSHRCDYDCPNRVQGEEFWSLFKSGAPLPTAGAQNPGISAAAADMQAGDLADRLIDRRGFGNIPGQLAKLLCTGESVLLLVADVARRRQLLSGLPLANSEIKQVLLAGSRCGNQVLQSRLDLLASAPPTLALCDFVTALKTPMLIHNFKHLVFIDPPLNQAIFNALTKASPGAYIHLLHCHNEVQFTKKVLEHEYSLRVPLTKVYKHLQTGKTYPLDETTERLLLAGGKYLRQPATVARCLAILEELSLIFVEDKAGKPIMTLLKGTKTELEASPTYQQSEAFYKECLRFLSKSLNAKVT